MSRFSKIPYEGDVSSYQMHVHKYVRMIFILIHDLSVFPVGFLYTYSYPLLTVFLAQQAMTIAII